MNICFTPTGWEDYQYWVIEDTKMEHRVLRLLKDIVRDPFKGLGKVEPLKGELQGWWARRIDNEHRLVYRIAGETVWVNQCRYYYKK